MRTPATKIPQLNIAGKLLVNGEQFQLGQIRQDSLVLQSPRDIAPCEAALIVTVNGKENTYSIFLPHGISSQSEIVAFF